MKQIALAKVTKGDFVMRKENAKTVYKLNGYCRISKAYELMDTEDISRCIYLKGKTTVFVGFTY